MKITLESLQNSKFVVDHNQLGLILGGANPNTFGGSRTLAAGTPQETTVTYSTDTTTSTGGETWHLNGSARDLMEVVPDMA